MPDCPGDPDYRSPTIRRLRYACQHYAWGNVGPDSCVYQYATLNDPSHLENKENPYAELWLGTHPNGPSTFHCNSNPLPIRLPFLLKALSIRHALSVQVHPSKQQAERLHRENPTLYKDPNHKPELAIALKPFEVLAGFKPRDQISRNLKLYPEFRKVVGQEATLALESDEAEMSVAGLKKMFENVLKLEPETLRATTQAMVRRIAEKLEQDPIVARQNALILRLNLTFPGDVGLFAPLYMNYINLAPSAAIYIGPGMLHAYLSGECIECMANSDNVIRAGLTPKHKDVETLLSMTEYKFCHPDDLLMSTERDGEGHVLYKPPQPDFRVKRCEAAHGLTLEPIATPSIVFVTRGSGKVTHGLCQTRDWVRGMAFLLEAGTQVTLQGDIQIFQAYDGQPEIATVTGFGSGSGCSAMMPETLGNKHGL